MVPKWFHHLWTEKGHVQRTRLHGLSLGLISKVGSRAPSTLVSKHAPLTQELLTTDPGTYIRIPVKDVCDIYFAIRRKPLAKTVVKVDTKGRQEWTCLAVTSP